MEPRDPKVISIRCNYCGRKLESMEKLYWHVFRCYPGSASLFLARMSYTIHPESAFSTAKGSFCEDCRARIRSYPRTIYRHIWEKHLDSMETMRYLLDISKTMPDEVIDGMVEAWSHNRPGRFRVFVEGAREGMTLDAFRASILLKR